MPRGVYPRAPLSEQHRARISAAMSGRKQTEEHVNNIARSMAEVFRKRQTPGELKMAALLLQAEVKFLPQVAIGRYIADFFVPPNIILEVDARYHKSRPSKRQADAVEDAALRTLGFEVIRINQEEL